MRRTVHCVSLCIGSNKKKTPPASSSGTLQIKVHYRKIRAARPSGIRSSNAWTPHHTCPTNPCNSAILAIPPLFHCYILHLSILTYSVCTLSLPSLHQLVCLSRPRKRNSPLTSHDLISAKQAFVHLKRYPAAFHRQPAPPLIELLAYNHCIYLLLFIPHFYPSPAIVVDSLAKTHWSRDPQEPHFLGLTL